MIISLPFPPSINHYWKHRVAGKKAIIYLSTEGVAFRSFASGMIDAGAAISDRVAVTIDLYPPNKRKFDIDNRVKAVLDALTHAGVWLDDEQVDQLIVNRCGIMAGGCCIVSIEILK